MTVNDLKDERTESGGSLHKKGINMQALEDEKATSTSTQKAARLSSLRETTK